VGSITLDIHTLFFSAIGALIGFQAVLFAIFSKTFAISEGLLPTDAKMDRITRVFNLELWLLIGGLLAFGGLGGAVYGIRVWEMHDFGALVPTHVMRVAIPSGFSLALGCQLILSAFFMSLLKMGRQ
jgi:hypothetical protein